MLSAKRRRVARAGRHPLPKNATKEQKSKYRHEYYLEYQERIKQKSREYYQTHRESVQKYAKQYRQAHKGKIKEYLRAWRSKYGKEKNLRDTNTRAALKREVYRHYSNGIVACANPYGLHLSPFTDMRALNIDHVAGRGKREPHSYYWYARNNYPPGFQLLCANCNWLKFISTTKNGGQPSQLRLKALERYTHGDHAGPKCSKCGVTDPRILQLDHISGGGTTERKKIGWAKRLYRTLELSNYPPGFQVLCVNCNFIKLHDNEELKHSRNVQPSTTFVLPRSFPQWSPKEQDVLQEYYGRISIYKLADLLPGRTLAAIRQRANEHGLIKYDWKTKNSSQSMLS